MKRLLSILGIIVFTSIFTSCGDSNLLTNPISGQEFEVAKKDFSNSMTLDDAKKACHELGDGWRLPTKYELNEMYKNKEEIGGFVVDYYWSSTETNVGAWGKNFDGGRELCYIYLNPLKVRAVRSL